MRATFTIVFTALALLAPRAASAHCDTLDGPVVNAARAALEDGKLEPVLAWVEPADEAEIRAAFGRARAVRKAGPEARDLADRWFFETVVRVHRAGEGAPFTGLAPAGAVEPAVAAVDRSLVSGTMKPVEALLVSAVRDGLHARSAKLAREAPPAQDVAAGRRWVAAYVPLVHWVEGVHQAATAGAAHGAAGAHEGHEVPPAEPRPAGAHAH